ncbi:peroxiredoxin family protein [Thiohalobacter sp.]|uniref:peroxiredoxin family protein n=1 Tax=Thiohalobacter sp. TaxID=2025948 RepID=UPI0026120F11|nr:redoxin domain-containing protein [Thiohalobacter sp.]
MKRLAWLWLLPALLTAAALMAAQPPAFEPTLKAAEPRPDAPDFALPDMDGRVHRLSDYRGKVVILNFWATWCPPCRREMPSMQRAWHKIRNEGIMMLAVNVGETEDTVFQFMGDYPMDFPVLFDHDGSVSEAWPMLALPTTFVIDPEGRIAYRAVGGREWDDDRLLDPVRALRRPAAEQ